MPDTTTPNYSLVRIQIGGSRDTWGDKLNDNWTALDTELKAVADAVATKLSSSGYTAADVLAKLITVDGAGSGIDADKLDGVEGSGYVLASGLLAAIAAVDGSGSGIDADKLDGVEGSGYATAGHNHDSTYLALAGGTVTGAITRSTRGVLPHYNASGMTSGQIYVAPSGGSDPTSQPGDLWLGY